MPGLRAATWRRLARVLALILLAWAVVPAPAMAFLDSLNPFADTKDEFEGRFIDSIEPEPWAPPLERLAAKRATNETQADMSRRRTGRAGEDDDSDIAPVPSEKAAPPPPPDPIPDGLILLRIGEDSIASAPIWEGYLEDIGARLLADAPVTGAPVQFYLTASEDYGTAKAYPDGAVGIPLGLLRLVDSEDELAFVLGHEASHVLLGHHDNDWFQSMNQNLVSAAEMALSMGVTVSEKLGQGGLRQDAAKIALIATSALFVVDKGLFPSFTREQEDEADLLGLDLMLRAGYNSQGAFDAFAKFQAWEAAMAERPSPQAQKRAALEEDITHSASQGAIDQAIQGVFQMFALAADEVAEEIAVTHRTAAAREESLLDYFFREYAEEVPPDSSASRLEAVRNDPEGQALFVSYSAARTAMSLIGEGKLAEAERMARQAVGGRYTTDSLARYAFFQTRLQQGKIDKAAKNLELALKGPRPSLAIYRELAEIHWARGKRKQAVALLDTAFEEFQQPPELYADLIYRHYLMGDKKKAEQMAVQCKFRNRKADKVCGKAAKGEAPRPAKRLVRTGAHGKSPPGAKTQDIKAGKDQGSQGGSGQGGAKGGGRKLQ